MAIDHSPPVRRPAGLGMATKAVAGAAAAVAGVDAEAMAPVAKDIRRAADRPPARRSKFSCINRWACALRSIGSHGIMPQPDERRGFGTCARMSLGPSRSRSMRVRHAK